MNLVRSFVEGVNLKRCCNSLKVFDDRLSFKEAAWVRVPFVLVLRLYRQGRWGWKATHRFKHGAAIGDAIPIMALVAKATIAMRPAMIGEDGRVVDALSGEVLKRAGCFEGWELHATVSSWNWVLVQRC